MDRSTALAVVTTACVASGLTYLAAKAAGGGAGGYLAPLKPERNMSSDFVPVEALGPPPETPLKLKRSKSEKARRDSDFTKGGKPIYTIVLTGGPCAGKTTALSRLSQYFSERGFRVFTVPEAATLMLTNGASFSDLKSDEHLVNFQGNLLQTQIHLEDTFRALARGTGSPSVLICDRGAMDGSAYIENDIWERILDRYGHENVQLRDKRYNAVFHLVTAADGAPTFYSLANNKERHEGIQEACKVDKLLQQAWIGHPNLVIFDNSTDFDGKIERLVDAASHVVGLPATNKRNFRKYLLKSKPEIPVRSEEFDVWKVYLQTTKSDEYAFVRKRAQGGVSSYGYTGVTNGVELKRIIKKRDYQAYVENSADYNRRVVRQRRVSFLWKTQYFDMYIYADLDICLLRCQPNSRSGKVTLPPWLDVQEEVTGNQDYGAYKLSLRPQHA